MKASDRPKARATNAQDVPGFAVRRIAADIVDGVLRRLRPLDELLVSLDELINGDLFGWINCKDVVVSQLHDHIPTQMQIICLSRSDIRFCGLCAANTRCNST